MMALEIERQRLAQELHDSIGQRLMFAKINLEIARKELNIKNDNLDQAIQNLATISNELSMVIKSLFPVSIEKYSLIQNLNSLISEFEKSSQIQVEINNEGVEPNLDKLTKLNLFRIFQELFNNIVKHSKATKVHVSIVFLKTSIKIVVHDNGIGFPVDTSMEQTKGTGLFSIKERISQLNGEIEFITDKMNGLKIIFEVQI
jgi:two-component system sensor histidine kinase ComP